MFKYTLNVENSSLRLPISKINNKRKSISIQSQNDNVLKFRLFQVDKYYAVELDSINIIM